jgi:hypothetical protein
MNISVATMPPESEESLLRVAYSCNDGLRILAKEFHSQLIIPFGILAGQCIESFLKCHLLQKGVPLKQVQRIGHDLELAWVEAAKHGSPIDGPVPVWVKVLNWGHSRPHPYRYLPDTYGAGCPQPNDFIELIPPILESLRRTCGRII